MASVDDRIVRMEFDNAAFERKLDTTITSLGKLNQALKFDGAKQGFSDVSAAAGRFNLHGISSAVEGVSTKFLALSTIAVTALATITSKAVTAGAQIAKSLSLDLVISGFKEYEQNIGSIQTILANTKAAGTNLQDVTGALDELNEYSDKTIYNFGQMTKNIGTFTAAGVDLDTSVQSIKGISNLAAISGSTSEQAATAMYQLSQAVSTGTLRLMDWNSVVNAGMGGEVFQKALFETGKAMGTIADTPMDTTFEEWTAAGNSFRGSLEEGWLTGEVLTTTLKGFTGEMTEAQLLAIGYTKEQAAEIIELGKTGVDAATKVRTLTGLIQTTKEAIGSGWSASFRLIFGDFEEATVLFSGVSNSISGMISKSADARNKLLGDWAKLGGRLYLIAGIQTAFRALGEIIAPIKKAFHDIFPPITAQRLADLSRGFLELMERMRPSSETLTKIRHIFLGFFGALEIGWTILKEGVKFFADLFGSISGAGSGDFLSFLARIGDFFTDLNEKLVAGGGIKDFFVDLKDTIVNFFTDVAAFIDSSGIGDFFVELKDDIVAFFTDVAAFISSGGIGDFIDDLTEDFGAFFTEVNAFVEESGIKDFFNDLKDAVKDPAAFISDLKDNLLELFDNLDIDALDTLGAAFGRFSDRFSTLKGLAGKIGDIWGPFKEGLSTIGGILEDVWTEISEFFSTIWEKVAEVLSGGDFNQVTDAMNVGLLAGIAALLAKFFKGGFKFDIGEGFLSNISKSFEELTGVLSAMQTSIKADALLKIAAAIALLTASVLVLSLIDSDALTKALIAMSVGFAQLMGSFAILSKMTMGPKGAASLSLLAGGMMLMAGAILILAFAAKALAGLDWNELAKGLTGVTILMGIMTGAALLLSKNTGGLIRAGIGMILISVALGILAGVVKIFSTMSWGEMAKGFAGVAAGLLIIAGAMQLMPKGMALQAFGLLLVATSLSILAGAVMLFATMDWGEMAKGFAGLAGGLLIIAGAMQLMPPTMPLIGAGLLLVSFALIAIAQAMSMIGDLSWEEIAKGLVGMAGALLILAIAANAMSGGIVGAVAIAIMAASLMLLVEVLKEFANLSWGELLMGLAGIALILGTLAVAALLIQPALGALFGLGAALLIIGAGFALFGLGASLVASAFERLAKAGSAGSEALIDALEAIGKAMPTLARGFAEGILEMVQVLADAAPELIAALTTILAVLIEGLIELIPEVLELIGTLISGILDLIAEKYPEFVETGIGLLISLLQGIRDNIGEVVTLVGEIITEFLDAMTEQVPNIITSVTNLFVEVITGVAEALGRVAATLMVGVGVSFITGFIQGLTDTAPGITSWFTDLAGKILGWIGDTLSTLWQKGSDLIGGLLSGIEAKATSVMTWFQGLIGKVLDWLGDTLNSLYNKGVDFISGILNGINDRITIVTTWFQNLITKVKEWIGNTIRSLWQKGMDFITGLWDGIKQKWESVTSWLGGLARKAINAVGDLANALFDIGKSIIEGLWNGMKDKWEDVKDWLGNLNPLSWFNDIAPKPGHADTNLVSTGEAVMQGLHRGMQSEWDNVAKWLTEINPSEHLDPIMGDRMATVLNGAISDMLDQIDTIDEFAPVITPVLDLTRIVEDSKKIGDYINNTAELTPTYSYTQARTISSGANAQIEDNVAQTDSNIGQLKFEQNIYAPAQLSTSDIYKNTRSQIRMAKQELSIP